MKKWGRIAFMLLVTLALTACQASLSEEGGLESFLTWLGTSVGVGIALSVILEKVPLVRRYFDLIQDMEWKRLIVLAICLALPLLFGGLARSLLFGYKLNADRIFMLLANGWDAFAAATITHIFVREPKKE